MFSRRKDRPYSFRGGKAVPSLPAVAGGQGGDIFTRRCVLQGGFWWLHLKELLGIPADKRGFGSSPLWSLPPANKAEETYGCTNHTDCLSSPVLFLFEANKYITGPSTLLGKLLCQHSRCLRWLPKEALSMQHSTPKRASDIDQVYVGLPGLQATYYFSCVFCLEVTIQKVQKMRCGWDWLLWGPAPEQHPSGGTGMDALRPAHPQEGSCAPVAQTPPLLCCPWHTAVPTGLADIHHGTQINVGMGTFT